MSEFLYQLIFFVEMLSSEYLRHSSRGTKWFNSTTRLVLVNPPDFSQHPHAEVGDIFMNKTEVGCRFWILEAGVETRFVW